MDAATLATLNRLLSTALDLPPAERESWIDTLEPEYESLKVRLRAMLAQQSQIESGNLFTTIPKVDDADDYAAGDAIGPYRLMRKLGAGGMAAVWMAERSDGVMKRPVALKLPYAGRALPGLPERMAREREILATLSHPNIARLYDAGVTAQGQPYLALEYVEGTRIDEYCTAKKLGARARLELFIQVATAVEHAHAKLVVHRDLKPGNILVTADGHVRLLDFGIAKLLEQGQAHETRLTHLAGRALTPYYASPEQIAGEPVTIQSDVYSLGVVLYELLTGTHPYQPERASAAALEEAILRTEPRRPSEAVDSRAVQRTLRGDLDTIALKALKKAPADRYATVNAFADDVSRYLAGRPVLARPDSATYRLRKFVGRNRIAVAASSAVALAILSGAAVALWQASVALAEQARAEEVKTFIASIFREADPFVGEGKALSALDLLRQAESRIDRTFTSRPQLRIELLNIVASSLTNLQDYDSAERVLKRAIVTSRQELGANHPLTRRARIIGLEVDRFKGRTAQMSAELAELLPQLRADPDAAVEDLVTVLENQAHLAIDEGRSADAEAAITEAFNLARTRLGEEHPQTVATSVVLALAYEYSKKPKEALVAAEHAFRLTTRVHEGNETHPRVIDARLMYGRALAGAGQLDAAIVELSRAADDAVKLFGPSGMMVAFISHQLARQLLERGDIPGAVAASKRSRDIVAEQTSTDSFTYAAAVRTHGIALLAARDVKEALPTLTHAVESLERALGPTHDAVESARVHRALALCYSGDIASARVVLDAVSKNDKFAASPAGSHLAYARGVVLRLGGDPAQGAREQLASLSSSEGDPRRGSERSQVLTEIGLDHLERGAHDEAVAALDRALTALDEIRWQHTPAYAEALLGRGRAHLGAGRNAEALPDLERADAFWRDFDADSRWAGEAALWLARGNAALGRDGPATAAMTRAERILARQR
jgi:eukaryotic-like serine/threonine-protein kinase